jgi:hypothetical protein
MYFNTQTEYVSEQRLAYGKNHSKIATLEKMLEDSYFSDFRSGKAARPKRVVKRALVEEVQENDTEKKRVLIEAAKKMTMTAMPTPVDQSARKRCPPGFRRNVKTGFCVPTTIAADQSARKRCPPGFRRNVKTGLCLPKVQTPMAPPKELQQFIKDNGIKVVQETTISEQKLWQMYKQRLTNAYFNQMRMKNQNTPYENLRAAAETAAYKHIVQMKKDGKPPPAAK